MVKAEDVDEWLTHYNNWNAPNQLRNAASFLDGTALVWFQNHVDVLNTWTHFIEKIRKCFGNADTKMK